MDRYLDCWDVVHFNNGMHGWSYSKDDYKKGYPEYFDAGGIYFNATGITAEGGQVAATLLQYLPVERKP